MQTFPNFAQAPATPKVIYSVTGKVIADTDNTPIEFATIALFAMAETKPLTGTTSSADGKFKVDLPKSGTYRLEISFVGFTKYRDTIQVLDANPILNLGVLKLKNSAATLKEVVVETERAQFQQSIDKKIFNVDKNNISKGGSALDVLQQVPSVSVDVDGNVNFRGSGNVNVLIDGKPVSMTGQGNAALQQLPASAIENVEIISNPSAKYDPDGVSGIINITLKKDKRQGYNATASVGVGTNQKSNGSLNLNYRANKWNYFGSYSYRDNLNDMMGDFYRENTRDTLIRFFNQDMKGETRLANHLGRVGADYSITPKQTAGVSASLGYTSSRNDQVTVFQGLSVSQIQTMLSARGSNTNNQNLNQDYNAYYKKTFVKPGKELSIDATLSQSNQESVADFVDKPGTDFNANYPDSLYYQQQTGVNRNQVSTIQADYVLPLPKEWKIEAGSKIIWRTIANNQNYTSRFGVKGDHDKLLFSESNEFDYQEQNYSAYMNLSGSRNKLSYQAGVRIEQSFVESQNNTFSYDKQFLNIFPSAFLLYKFNDKRQSRISYSKRINRPGIGSLNPIRDYNNPFINLVGNPDLKPEYIHSLEWSLFQNIKKGSISATGYYRYTDAAITRIAVVENNISTVQFLNAAQQSTYGLELLANVEWVKWASTNLSFNFYNTAITASTKGLTYTNQDYSFSTRLAANIFLYKGLGLQLTGNYTAPSVVAQGMINPFTNVDVALKKDLWKKKASLSLAVADVFNTLQFSIATSGDGFIQTAVRKRETRIATLNFTYRFGKGEQPLFKSKANKGSNAEIKMDEGGL